MGKASTRAQNRYITKAYDRINLTVYKGVKDEIRMHAERQGESVNAFIQRAIREQIARDMASMDGDQHGGQHGNDRQ